MPLANDEDDVDRIDLIANTGKRKGKRIKDGGLDID